MPIMCISVFTFLLLVSGIIGEEANSVYLKFRQHDYKIKFEWGEVVRYNKQYLKEFRFIVFKYNRTCTAGNLTTLYDIDIGNDLELITQAYRFASNEYRTFPIRLQVNFCVAVKNNLIGSQAVLTNCGNFNGCPIKKGVRNVICNFAPDPSQFPPFIPTGKYKLQVQAMYHNQEMSVINVYGEVYRPITEE